MDSEADQISSDKDAGAAGTGPDKSAGGARAVAALLLVSLLAVATAVYWQDLVPLGEGMVPADSVPQVAETNETEALSPEQVKASLDSLQRQVRQLRDDIDGLSVSTNLFWALSEVEYLLTTASYKLSAEGDVNAALRLLGHADTRLEDIHVPELQETRSHIADAMSALRAAPAHSVPELMAMLDGLADMIFNAEDAPATMAEEPQARHAEDEAAPDGDDAWWSFAWRDVRSMIRIERAPGAGDAARPRKAELELRRSLHELRLAALRGDDGIFQAALAGLRDKLVSSGEISPPLARELEALAAARMRPEVDDTALRSALETLRAYQRGGQ